MQDGNRWSQTSAARAVRSVRARRIESAAAILLFFLTFVGPAWAAGLDSALQKKVQAATFEVVVPKPIDDPLTYEKPLPLDLLPYQFRNDKYFSVGTAFAIGNGRYATAGHVFAVGVGGFWGAPALRDTAGNVYQVAQIEKYSAHEDFVVFTLATVPVKVKPLEINTKPTLNDTVYSVGNALGDGVVIRDGLYTSDTPENQDGRWKWLRFSAAASPGNSGGPLLDKDGKIIGIVLMKSPNENLNYAVSIDQVLKAPEHLARIDTRSEFRLDIFDKAKSESFKQEFPLPKSFADFSATYLKLREEFDARGRHDLLAENAAITFPHGKGSNKLLHTTYEKVLPALIVLNQNEVWNFDAPRYTRVDLDGGGSVDWGTLKSNVLLHFRMPGDVDAAKLYSDPTLYMQLTLKATPLYRPIGSENIKITSLGKPAEDSTFTDAWGRTWQQRIWPIAYNNTAMISLDLPVPSGYVSMRRIGTANFLAENLEQMKTLTGFVAVSYGGKLSQWQNFMAIKNVLPPALSPAMIHFDYGKNFAYQSKRVAFAYTPELQKIDKDNHLVLDFGFFSEAGKIIWDVAGVAVRDDIEGKTEVGTFRHPAPSDDMEEGFKKSWDKRLRHAHPYDAIALQEQGQQYIRTVYGKPDPKPAPEVLYTFVYRAESNTPQDKMKAKLNLLMKNAKVDER